MLKEQKGKSMEQVGFPFDALNPSHRPERKVREKVDHEGDCILDLDKPTEFKAVSSTLRCTLSKDHRFKLDPSTRQGVMKTLLRRGALIGDAKSEAEDWENGRTPYGFTTKW